MFGIGPPEMIIVGIIALLLFGKRLPEVARSLGKGIVEFKKGMNGIEDDLHNAGSASTQSSTSSRPSVDNDEQTWSAPRFEPPTSAPKSESESETHV